MSRYLQDIVRYFFHHEVSRETASKVHDRISQSREDIDPALHEIWDELEGQTMDGKRIDEAYQETSRRLFGEVTYRRQHLWLRIAAVWAVPLLLLGVSWYFYQRGSQLATDAKVTYMHKFTAYGEYELVTLPDSTKVWLNGGSTLIYPSRFVSSDRNVCLSGEAFFDVTKDASHPFVVNINQIKVKVLGTTFNVSSYPNNEDITTTLETGKVELTVEGKAKPYILNPNDQLVYNSKTGEVSISQVNAKRYSSWRSGELFFNNIPFDKVIEQLERAYHVNIYVLSGKYSSQTLRAHFNSKDTIKDVMDIFKMLIPDLQYEIKDSDIYIR